MGERVNLQSRRELLKQFARRIARPSLPRNACCWIPLPRAPPRPGSRETSPLPWTPRGMNALLLSALLLE
ncbi:MAG TPA: hypothetical protein VF043_20385 [Ktedonobacteraceae bacterium]